MRILTLRIAAAAVTLATCGIASCGSSSSVVKDLVRAGTGGVVTSPDGRLTLDIPPGALPRDTTVSIGSGDTVRIPEAFSGAHDAGSAYQLGPNGLRFSKPVIVKLSLPLAGTRIGTKDAIPMLLTTDGSGNLESLDGQAVEIDLHSKTVSITAAAVHFSDVNAVDVAKYSFTPEAAYSQVGGSWPGTLTVTDLLPEAYTPFHWKTIPGYENRTTRPTFLVSGRGYVDPQENGPLSGPTQDFGQWIDAGNTATIAVGTFGCVQQGNGTFGARFYLRIGYREQGDNAIHLRSSSAIVTVSSAGDCAQNGGGEGPSTITTVVEPTTTSSTVTVPPAYPSAIQAVFNQSGYSTVYTEPVTNPAWKYAWSVSIPADPNCSGGFQGNSPAPNQASWYHADLSEGGPCNHDTYSDTFGHPGQVTLVVTPADGSWSCTANFYGTAPNTSPGSPPATGSPPQCTRR